MENKKLLTVKEVAALLCTKESHIRNMVHKKTIPYLKIGGYLRFDHESILEWLKQHTSTVK